MPAVSRVTDRVTERLPEHVRAVARGSTIVLVIQVGGAGFRYLGQVLFARWLGPRRLGQFSLAVNIAELAAVLACLGLNSAVLKFVPQYVSRGEGSLIRGIVRRSRQTTVASGAVLGAVVTGIVVWADPHGWNLAAVIIAAAAIPIVAISNLEQEVARAVHRMALAYAPFTLIQPMLIVVFGGTVLVVFGQRSTPAATLVYIGAIATSIALQRPGLRRAYVDWTQRPRYRTREWLDVGIPLLLVAGFAIVVAQADVIVVGIISGPRAAGIYVAASKTAALATLTLLAVNGIVVPMIASADADGRLDRLQATVGVAAHWMFWSALAVGAGLLVFAVPVLRLFGPAFVSARGALTILVVGQVINAAAGPVAYLAALTGFHRQAARAQGLAALANIILCAALVPVWGLEGAAVSSTAAVAIWNVWLSVIILRRLGIRSSVVTIAWHRMAT